MYLVFYFNTNFEYLTQHWLTFFGGGVGRVIATVLSYVQSNQKSELKMAGKSQKYLWPWSRKQKSNGFYRILAAYLAIGRDQ